MRRARSWSRDAGFTLVEVLVAMLLALALAAGASSLFVVAGSSVRGAREATGAVMLAAQKLEELRGAPWASAALSASPADALDTEVAGYSDVIDSHGRPVGIGTSGRPAACVRRWSVRPVPTDPARGVVIAVVVLTARRAQDPLGASRPSGQADAFVTSLRSLR